MNGRWRLHCCRSLSREVAFADVAVRAITCRSRSPIERQEQTGCCRSSFAAEWRRLPKAALHTFSWRAAALLRNLTFAAIVEENRIQ